MHKWNIIGGDTGEVSVRNGVATEIAEVSDLFHMAIRNAYSKDWCVVCLVSVADSTWSFYNLNSAMPLDVPAASKSTGVQLDQYFTNNNSNQKFNLISR